MIIVKVLGGLGNQMFQFACGYALAQSNGTTLKLDITGFDNYPLRNYELDKFNVRANYASVNEIKRIKYRPMSFVEKVIRKLVKKSLTLSMHYHKEQHFHFDLNLFKTEKNIYLDGYWQSEKYFARYRDDLLQIFTLKAKLHEQTELYKKMIEEREAVSLHIRRGDYVSNAYTNSVHGICSLEYYENTVKMIIDRVKNPHFYIFSDDLAWAKEHLIFINDITFIELDKDALDHEELYLMSQCKYNIIANSSFSWWGAWLNQNAQKIVIAPKKWFNDNTINTGDLIPESWFRL